MEEREKLYNISLNNSFFQAILNPSHYNSNLQIRRMKEKYFGRLSLR